MDVVVWFRHDLRIRDNAALFHANNEGDAIIPVVIVNKKKFKLFYQSSAKARFLYRTVQNLMQNLEKRDSRLIIRVGDEKEELEKILRESGAKAIYFNRCYHSEIFRSDSRLIKYFEQKGFVVKAFHNEMVFAPDSILDKKKPITSFVQYRTKWLEKDRPAPFPNIESLYFKPKKKKGTKTLNELHSDTLPDLKELGFTVSGKLPGAGEDEALDLLSWFFDRRVMYYSSQRAFPQVEGTSKMSPHVTIGSISPRLILDILVNVWQRATETQKKSVDNWLVSYIWRDYYHQLLFHFPRLRKEPYQKQFIDFPFENDEKFFTAWQEGRTGIPIIDAGMRQLATEFWMHGRLRVILASFLVKNLLVDWRLGVKYFLEHVIDADEATTIGSFQWVASMGATIQRPFEVIDPVEQSILMDREGNFIRAKLPVLAKVPDEYIHEPWKMPKEIQKSIGVVIGKDYPKQVTNYKKNAKRFLELYREALR